MIFNRRRRRKSLLFVTLETNKLTKGAGHTTLQQKMIMEARR